MNKDLDYLLHSYDWRSPVLVHTDLFGASYFGRGKDPVEYHSRLLIEQLGQYNMWVPSFNYDFFKSRTTDTLKAVSQVGPITEYARGLFPFRSSDPVFMVASERPIKTSEKNLITAFGKETVWGELRKGGILFYGLGIRALTYIHHVEYLAQSPYRYNKSFFGELDSRSIEYVYHCRPLGHYLEYDWRRIEDDLVRFGIMARIKSGHYTVAAYFNVFTFQEFILDKLRRDPFYLLDSKSRGWVEPMIDALGRAFRRKDFEK